MVLECGDVPVSSLSILPSPNARNIETRKESQDMDLRRSAAAIRAATINHHALLPCVPEMLYSYDTHMSFDPGMV